MKRDLLRCIHHFKEIKTLTHVKNFHFWVKYAVFIENENECLKNYDFCYTHIQQLVQISDRSNQYSRRYGILKSCPIRISLCCIFIEMLEKNVIPIGYDFSLNDLEFPLLLLVSDWPRRCCIVVLPPSHISPRKNGYIVEFPPGKWLYSSFSPRRNLAI